MSRIEPDNRLLPCPFCGEKRIFLNQPNKAAGFKGSVNCPGCLASLPREVNSDEELIRCWNARVSPTRDDIQQIVVDWGTRCFGAAHMNDAIVRAARFIEEAAELVQAVGLPIAHTLRAIHHVYSRPAGNSEQEMGGVSNTQYALAAALDLSVGECEASEIARCLAKDPKDFAQRNLDKVKSIDSDKLTEGG